MISFLARDGRRMFAFDPPTDPLEVLIELAWAWPNGQHLCGHSCPRSESQSYCLDCHAIAGAARDTARTKMEAA